MFTCDQIETIQRKRDEGTEDTQQTDSDRDSHRFHRPEVITQVCHNLHPDTFVHPPHLLGAEFRDPNTHCVILPLSAYHNGRACRQRLFSRRQIPSSGCQSRTHHVCTANQESDGTSVHPDRRQDVRICVTGFDHPVSRRSDHLHAHIYGPPSVLGRTAHQNAERTGVRLAQRISQGGPCWTDKSSRHDASDSIEMNTDHFTWISDSFLGHRASSVSGSIFH